MRSVATFVGFAGGWSLGAWESGVLVGQLSAAFQSLDLWMVALFTPAFAYGLLGAIAGFLFGLVVRDSRRGRWALLGLVAVTLLAGVWWTWKSSQGRQPLRSPVPPALGALAALGILFSAAGYTLREARAARLVLRGLLVVAVTYVPVFFITMGVRSSGLPLAPRPAVGAPPAGKPNIVLVNWDTVRADTLPLFGGAGLDTPELDRLAAEGVLFTNFHAVAPITGPSHASMLSGLYPPTHGMRSNNDMPPPVPWKRLPELCAEAGYATGGFVSGYPLRAQYGFDRGFQIFDDRPTETLMEAAKGALFFTSSLARRFLPPSWDASGKATPGEITLERALRWYRGVERPAFLWIHFYDAHYPYTPPQEYRARALARAEEGPRPLDPDAEEEWVLQRGEIEQLDALLGELREALEEKDPGLKNTIIALAADHGECFGEGGLIGSHHRSLYQATQLVVGVIRPATGAPGIETAQRLDVTASQVDLMPTLCELAGIEIEDELHGASLVRAMRGATPMGSRPLYMEAWQRDLQESKEAMHGLYLDGWKLTLGLDGEWRLYDERSEDPNRDRAQEEPEQLERMKQELVKAIQGIPVTEGAEEDLSPGAQAAMSELGYTTGEDRAYEDQPIEGR